jgi:hypothetical protein
VAALTLLSAGRRAARSPALGAAGAPSGPRRSCLNAAVALAEPTPSSLGWWPASRSTVPWLGMAILRRFSAELERSIILTLSLAGSAGLGLGLLRFSAAMLTVKTRVVLHLECLLRRLARWKHDPGVLVRWTVLLSNPSQGRCSDRRLLDMAPCYLAVVLGCSCLAWPRQRDLPRAFSLSGKEAVFGLGMLAGLGLCLIFSCRPGPGFGSAPSLANTGSGGSAAAGGLTGLVRYVIDERASLVILLRTGYLANTSGWRDRSRAAGLAQAPGAVGCTAGRRLARPGHPVAPASPSILLVWKRP